MASRRAMTLGTAGVVSVVLIGTLLGGSAAATAGRHRGHRGHAAASPGLVVAASPRAGTGPVSAGLEGANLRWVRDADGAWDPGAGTIRDSVALLARRSHLSSVRYPGGTVANLFDYRNALPGAATRCQTSGGGNFLPGLGTVQPSKSEFGFAAQADFLSASGATSNLMLPMVNATPADAVAFVQAFHDATGQRSVDVELGNEPNLPAQRYWRSDDPATRLRQYAFGGTQFQGHETGVNADNNDALFAATGCDLADPAVATGQPNQVYRTRYRPILVTGDQAPRVWVGGDRWQQVSDLSQAGPADQVFTADAVTGQVRFGDGTHGAVPPSGASLTANYWTQQPGFTAFYAALHAYDQSNPDVDLRICSGWGQVPFAQLMNRAHQPYDCQTPHSYFRVFSTRPTGALREMMTKAARESAELGALRAAMRSPGTPAARARFLDVTEYGVLDIRRATLKSEFVFDLAIARMMIGQINTGVHIADIANFGKLFVPTSDGGRGLSGRAYVLDLVGRLAGQTPVPVHGTLSDVDLVGTRAGARRSLLVLNKRSQSVRTPVTFSGLRGPQCVAVRRMSGPLAASDQPATVGSLLHTGVSRWAGNGSLSATFPPYSVTLLSLAPATGAGCTRPIF